MIFFLILICNIIGIFSTQYKLIINFLKYGKTQIMEQIRK